MPRLAVLFLTISSCLLALPIEVAAQGTCGGHRIEWIGGDPPAGQL